MTCFCSVVTGRWLQVESLRTVMTNASPFFAVRVLPEPVWSLYHAIHRLRACPFAVSRNNFGAKCLRVSYANRGGRRVCHSMFLLQCT